jgi:hypothetical protein
LYNFQLIAIAVSSKNLKELIKKLGKFSLPSIKSSYFFSPHCFDNFSSPFLRSRGNCRKKLVIASVLCLAFMIVEIVGEFCQTFCLFRLRWDGVQMRGLENKSN